MENATGKGQHSRRLRSTQAAQKRTTSAYQATQEKPVTGTSPLLGGRNPAEIELTMSYPCRSAGAAPGDGKESARRRAEHGRVKAVQRTSWTPL